MADMFSEFGIDINLSASGFENIMSKFSRLASEGGKIGKTTDQISDAMRRLASAMAHALNVDSAKKFAEAMRTADSSIRARLLQEIANNAEKLRTIQKALGKSLNDLVNPPGNGGGKSNLDQLIESGKGLIALWGQIKVAIQPAKKIYDFTNALATLNMQLRMLHYSSGMAVASLKAFGAVSELYGGSAQSIASYTERHKVQEARAQRGLGLGHFQEAEWQFGFRYLPGEDAMARRRRAIEHASTLDEESRIAFAKMEDPSGYREILSWAKRGVKDFDAFQAYVKNVTSMKTSDGRNIYDAATEESEKYKESVAKLRVQLDAAKQEFLLSVLPTIRRLVDSMSDFAAAINRLSPATKQAMGKLIAAIGLAVSAFLLYATLKNSFALLRKTLMGEAASSATGGIGGGIGSVGGKVTGVLAGSVGSSVIGAVGQVGLGYEIWEIAQNILSPWFVAWKGVNMARGNASKNNNIKDYLVAGGIDEKEAKLLANAGRGDLVFKEQQFEDNKALYKKIESLVNVMSYSGEIAQTAKMTSSYIQGNVETNNDNRTVTVNQTFVSSGDIGRDAEIAGNSMKNSVKAALLDI